MRKSALIVVALMTISAPASAGGESPAGPSTEKYEFVRCQATVDGDKMGGYCWDNDADAPVEHELVDGTVMSVEAKDVYYVAKDGRRTPAPDGEHITRGGLKIITRDGVLVE